VHTSVVLGLLSQIQDESFTVNDFDVARDVDGSQGVVSSDHDALEERQVSINPERYKRENDVHDEKHPPTSSKPESHPPSTDNGTQGTQQTSAGSQRPSYAAC
jgi:hypothetical protein